MNIKEARADLVEGTTTTHIDLFSLVEESRTRSQRELAKMIEARQERLIMELCGPRYSRAYPYKRGGSYTKNLVTPIGAIKFRVKKVINRQTGKGSSPILKLIDVKKRRYSRGIRIACAEYASKMSYGDASLEYETGTGIKVPKRTIHTWVKEIAPLLLGSYSKAREAEPEPETVLAIGDSTVVRCMGEGEMNQVRVLINGEGDLLCLKVNEPWPEMKVDILVSDDEPGLAERIEAEWHQLCVLHAAKRLGFILWGDKMSLEERKIALDAVRGPLMTLVHSVEKHRLDGDMDRVRWRTDWTLGMLHEAALDLRDRGLRKAFEYVENHAGLLVTFAELALEGIEVPYTTNLVERLMGEVAKRCKNKWMHWGTEGLRCVLIFVLVRYSDEEMYERFKKAYIHNMAFTY